MEENQNAGTDATENTPAPKKRGPKPGSKRKAKGSATAGKVVVARQVTSVITVGKDNYTLKPTEDGRGVTAQNEAGSLFVPYGEAGTAVVNELRSLVAGKQVRRGRKAKA